MHNDSIHYALKIYPLWITTLSVMYKTVKHSYFTAELGSSDAQKM